VRGLTSLAALAAGMVIAVSPAGASTRDQRLQAVADGLVSNVFVGGGLLGGLQAFYVPGAVLTGVLRGTLRALR
jgi:hypothetical protein